MFLGLPGLIWGLLVPEVPSIQTNCFSRFLTGVLFAVVVIEGIFLSIFMNFGLLLDGAPEEMSLTLS